MMRSPPPHHQAVAASTLYRLYQQSLRQNGRPLTAWTPEDYRLVQTKHLARQRVQSDADLQRGIVRIQRQVLGYLPQTNTRTGNQFNKVQLKGVYLNQYYPTPMADVARKIIPGYKTELEERQATKLMQLQRRGKGPPKKGSGARSKKK